MAQKLIKLTIIKVTTISTPLAFRQFFNFLRFGASTPELGPQNPSPGRKFYVESDFEVKNDQFRRPGAKI